jgi:hypothetical protein
MRNPAPVTAIVTLSYLAYGFDWAADYVATLSEDGRTMDLGAWVTLANGNGVGFPNASTQIVAGAVNHESGEVEPLDPGGPILAQCWPQGSTSDSMPQYLQLAGAAANGIDMDRMFKRSVAAPVALQEIAVTSARRVVQEQLGDLKLYRVPERTTVASRQSKQVRLLDKSAIPVAIVYGADLGAGTTDAAVPAMRLLRTQNTAANRLGLALPSGHIAVFARRDAANLLLDESGIRDLAVDEDVEVELGESPDVTVSAQVERTTIDPKQAHALPLVPGVTLRTAKVYDIRRVEISNARAAPIQFELRLRLPDGGRVVRADHPMGRKNGRPIFRLTIPANQTATLRYQCADEQATVHRAGS